MSFAAFACAHGLIVHDVYPSDKIRRCPTESHPRSKNGAFWFDGQRGWVYLHDADAKTIWWNDASAQPWSDAEKKAWGAKKREAEQKREAGYRRAAAAAVDTVKACKPEQHNYLRSKQLPDVLGLVDAEQSLIVPMRHIVNNELMGVQKIRWLMDERKWEKKMSFGMRAKGAVFRLGSAKAPETYLVEGYATGLTLEAVLRRLSLPASVLVCFSANNLMHVAPLINGRKFVFADHDASGTGEEAAKATGLPYCMSPVEGEDANDMFSRSGLLAVCRLVMGLRQ